MASEEIIMNTNTEDVIDPRDLLFDDQWYKNTFLLTGETESKYREWLNRNKYFSTADVKFTSSAVGLSMGCNPKPQFTRTCDIRRPGLIEGRDPNKMRMTGVPGYTINTGSYHLGIGMGTYYSEAIDDTQQRIFMRFGEPQYMGMLHWIGKGFDIHKAILYKRGFISGTIIKLVNAASKIWAIASSPWITTAKVLLENFIMPGRFVSVKDNMYSYWAGVQVLLNQMYVRRTKVPFKLQGMTTGGGGFIGQEMEISQEFVSELNSIMPGIVDGVTGQISVFTIALRAASVYNLIQVDVNKKNIDFNPIDDRRIGETRIDSYFTNRKGHPSGFITRIFHAAASWGGANVVEESMKTANSLIDAGTSWFKGTTRTVSPDEDIPYSPAMNPRSTGPKGKELGPANGEPDKLDQENAARKASEFDTIGRYILAVLSEGAAFACFNVEHTGSVGESFSNSVENNPIETMFNSISSQIRSLTSSMQGLFDVPMVGSVAGTAAGAISTVASNISLGLANPILALLWGTSISLPKVWNGSSATMPTATYRMRLQSPYNNAYSQLFNIFLPLSMVLVSGLPRKVGINSYTAPFMCQLFDRGRVNIPYGVVSNISIVRGVSNLAFNKAGQANAIDVEFTVMDLNEIIAVDITANGVLSAAMDNLIPDLTNDAITNYVNTLTAMDAYSMFYLGPSARLKLAETELKLRTLFTDEAAIGAFWGSFNPIPEITGALSPGNASTVIDMRTR